ncbi:acyltransferase family protein [Akkermansia glycaniphila]|uniref:Acyltransferase 3 domain-containing protein n=1 Tax=Akkermansia glycaniphila TaxID=1679444 RepID=A0A1C7PCL2_9BACT|nr:acyltransferase family protein [Akkermansia glycaniphila]OCA03265.1 hypothetical protein AC781_05185 [Akkermansia glycaniphila]SEH81628.1 Hypothetical protein PYTT_0956 [Akkermansia glycaniphila]
MSGSEVFFAMEVKGGSPRAGWVELCRFVGLYAVILLHVEAGQAGWLRQVLWGNYVSWNGLFFLISAYFLGRTRAPMLQRAGFFLKFYFLWNAVFFLCKTVWLAPWAEGHSFPYTVWDCIRLMLGVDCQSWSDGGSMPWDYPLWFLRDLMMMMAVFSFFRTRRVRAIGSLVLCAVSCVQPVNEAAVFYGLPGEQSWWFFCAGMLLSSVDLEVWQRFLMRSGYCFVVGFAFFFVFRCPAVWDVPVLSMVLRLIVVAAVLTVSVWICAAVPAVGRWSAVFSPVFFFIYASHAVYLGLLSGKGIDSVWAWAALSLLYMVAAVVFFRLVKKYRPSWTGILFARPMRR